VGGAAGQLAHRFHFLPLAELLFRPGKALLFSDTSCHIVDELVRPDPVTFAVLARYCTFVAAALASAIAECCHFRLFLFSAFSFRDSLKTLVNKLGSAIQFVGIFVGIRILTSGEFR
jgi:hypothetical protein